MPGLLKVDECTYDEFPVNSPIMSAESCLLECSFHRPHMNGLKSIKFPPANQKIRLHLMGKPKTRFLIVNLFYRQLSLRLPVLLSLVVFLFTICLTDGSCLFNCNEL